MPRKDHEAALEYQRKYYSRPSRSRAYRAMFNAKDRAEKKYQCSHKANRYACAICCPLSVIKNYRHRAVEKGRAFELSDAQAVYLFNLPCIYCPTTPAGGIDRVENEYDYTELNSVPCCSRCNYIKRMLTVSALFLAIEAIRNKNPSYEIFAATWERVKEGLKAQT